jgi:ATP-binding cassette, subfamily B, bacterial MsbA
MTRTARQIIARVLHFVRPFAWLLVLSMVFNLLFSALNAMTLAIVEPVFRTLFDSAAPQQAPSAAASTPIGTGLSIKAQFDQFMYGLVTGPDMATTIRNLGIAIFLLFLARGMAKYASSIVSTRLEEGIMKSIRDQLFARITSLSMEFFGRKRSGEIISVLTNDVGVLNHSTINSITSLWREATTVIIYVALLLMISVKLTGMALLIAVSGLVVIRTATQFLRKYAQRMQAAQADYTTTLQETVAGIRVVKGMGVEPSMNERFRAQTQRFVRSALKNTRVLSLVPAVNDTFGIMALVAVFYAGGSALAAGELTAPNLMTFLFLLFGLMQPISTIVGTVATMQRGLVAASNVLDILDEAPSVPSGHRDIEGFRDRVSVQQVTFSYGDRDVVRDVTFDIPRGKTIALVGSSGSGKSTMLDLLMRFYDPAVGSVTIDGADVRDLSLSAYRRVFGTVSQETILFNDTIANNIALGETQPDMERVEQVARIAHAHDFIAAMPDGYATSIGDRGMKLSGGQRQRIAIARALYRDPQILLFDEATSALDTASERVVQEAITDVLRGRTAVVVAHRLSTIMQADEILVFDHGTIVERGTHAELLQRNGVYASLHALQFGTAS